MEFIMNLIQPNHTIPAQNECVHFMYVCNDKTFSFNLTHMCHYNFNTYNSTLKTPSTVLCGVLYQHTACTHSHARENSYQKHCFTVQCYLNLFVIIPPHTAQAIVAVKRRKGEKKNKINSNTLRQRIYETVLYRCNNVEKKTTD